MRRRLFRGLLLNYVMEHVRGISWRALIIRFMTCHASATSPWLLSAVHYLSGLSIVSNAVTSAFKLFIVCNVCIMFQRNGHQRFRLLFVNVL